MASANDAALYDARRRIGSSSQMLDSIIQASNCERIEQGAMVAAVLTLFCSVSVDRDEVDRLRKRFMKLDKVDGVPRKPLCPSLWLIRMLRRTIQVQLSAMNFSPCLKSLQIPWLPGILFLHCVFLPAANDIIPRSFSMIAIFDEDGGGDVDFQEFVSGLSAFSSKGNKEEKLRFAFKVYDIDRDGYISNGELFIVLKMMVGSNLKDQQLQQVCRFQMQGLAVDSGR